MQNQKLEVGEKYLSIQMFGGQLKLVAFPNKNKTKEHSPDFVGDGLKIWVNTKKAETPQFQPNVTSTTIGQQNALNQVANNLKKLWTPPTSNPPL